MTQSKMHICVASEHVRRLKRDGKRSNHMLTEFEQGILAAAGILVRSHDLPGPAADILISSGLAEADCSAMDDFDKEGLRKIQGERRGAIRLKGL